MKRHELERKLCALLGLTRVRRLSIHFGAKEVPYVIAEIWVNDKEEDIVKILQAYSFKKITT